MPCVQLIVPPLQPEAVRAADVVPSLYVGLMDKIGASGGVQFGTITTKEAEAAELAQPFTEQVAE